MYLCISSWLDSQYSCTWYNFYINGYTTNQCSLISAAPSMLLRNPVIYLTSYHTSPSGPVQAFCKADRLHFPTHSAPSPKAPFIFLLFQARPFICSLDFTLSILLVLGSKIFLLVLQQMFQSFSRSLLSFTSPLRNLARVLCLLCKLDHCV